MSIHSDNIFDMEIACGERSDALALLPGTETEDRSAIIGRDGYSFILAGTNRWDDQVNGNYRINTKDLIKSVGILHSIAAKCKSMNIRFSAVIIPEKDIIYPERATLWDGKEPATRSVDLLKLGYTDLLYPVAELQSYKHICQVYHPQDSHYNAFGGYVLANAVLKDVGSKKLVYDEIGFTHAPVQDDIAVKWDLPPYTRRMLAEDYETTLINQGPTQTGLHLRFDSRRSTNGKTVIVYGDSYSWNPDSGLARFLTHRFQTVHFVWDRKVNWTFVGQVQPEALVIEAAERFLVSGLVR